MSSFTNTEHATNAKPPAARPTSGKTPIKLEGCRTKAEVELARKLLKQAKDLPPTRSDRVRELRAALLAGTYKEDAALDEALDRLLDECAADSPASPDSR